MKKAMCMIFVLALIVGGIFIVKNHKTEDSQEESSNTSTTESEVIRTDIVNSVTSTGAVESALEEKKQLHTTYYFEEAYFGANQLISAGENILKYTNGTYMTAPYNCVITEMNLPDSSSMCTNEHYITLQSIDTLQLSLSVEESKISQISMGKEANIELESLGKTYIGYVTNIENSATYSSSGSTFAIDVQLENDGSIMIGMTAKCSIVLEKAENVIAVATEAIEEQNGKNYVTVKNGDDSTKQVEIEIGIANDAYTEVKSGLNEGDIVIIEKEESSSNGHGGNQRQMQFDRSEGSSRRNERWRKWWRWYATRYAI